MHPLHLVSNRRFFSLLCRGLLILLWLMPIVGRAAEEGEIIPLPVPFFTYVITPGKLTGKEFTLEKTRWREFRFDPFLTYQKPKETVTARFSLRGGYRPQDFFGHDDFEPKEPKDVVTGWLPQSGGSFLIFPDQSKEHLPKWIPERTRLIRVPLIKQYGDTVVNAYDLALGLDRVSKGEAEPIPFQLIPTTAESGKTGMRLVPAKPLVDGVYYAYSLPEDREKYHGLLHGFLFAVGTPASGSGIIQPVQVKTDDLQNILDRREEIRKAPDHLPPLQDTYLWPKVKDYALISQAVYKFGSVPNYADKCPVDGMECSKNIPGTSFQAQVYVSKTDKTLVIAFRGTEFDSSSDWQADVLNFFGKVPEQYEQAVSFVKQVVDKAKPHDYEIVVTGHSLGGGLAAYAALACEQHAVVFNAAGLGEGLKHKVFANFQDFAALVTNIDVKGDPVSRMGKQVGTVYTVNPPASLVARWESHRNATGPANAFDDIIDPHLMENVILSLQEIKK